MKYKEANPIKRRVIGYALGVAGIVAAIVLARALSSGFYQNGEASAEPEAAAVVETAPEAETEAETEAAPEADETEAVSALAEEEIYGLFADAKLEAEEGAAGEEEYISPIDFERLWDINKHVYAWITVPGTSIDYPILQHPTNNSKYLEYNIDGSYGRPGCIYTENMNALDFTDPNTVIYGHNMRNGTMFAQLHEFRNSDFFEKNREVVIYLPDRELRYYVFAAYVYDDRHLMYSFDFADPNVYAAYLDAIYNRRDASANIDRDSDVRADDRIITLATCVRGQDDKRLLVQAVLDNPEALEGL
ncbi:MAG: class B sortase [Lachnospiraceae bacterium]|jgi:sortase B|nr:class B sortase [Lachnospiraceae bacterium]